MDSIFSVHIVSVETVVALKQEWTFVHQLLSLQNVRYFTPSVFVLFAIRTYKISHATHNTQDFSCCKLLMLLCMLLLSQQ